MISLFQYIVWNINEKYTKKNEKKLRKINRKNKNMDEARTETKHPTSTLTQTNIQYSNIANILITFTNIYTSQDKGMTASFSLRQQQMYSSSDCLNEPHAVDWTVSSGTVCLYWCFISYSIQFEYHFILIFCLRDLTLCAIQTHIHSRMKPLNTFFFVSLVLY